MRSTKIIKICSSSLCTCLHHMVILRTRNKITDFFMILAWASPFKILLATPALSLAHPLGILPMSVDNGSLPTPSVGPLPGPITD